MMQVLKLGLLLLLGACSVRGPTMGNGCAFARYDPTPTVVSDSITLWLHAPATVRQGEPVPLRLEIENTSRISIWLTLQGRGPRADFVITDLAGSEVWSYFRGLEWVLAGGEGLLGPTERLVLPFTWDQTSHSRLMPGPPVEPGDYLLRGGVILLGDGFIETQPRLLRIVP